MKNAISDIEWAPRVSKKKIRKLYESEATGLLDETLLDDVGISQTDIASQRMSKYAIKMVFKSKIDQLVKFLYDVQDSARWLKVDSMRIGISERKETTLSVELSMTAMVLYGLAE